jgi:regulator of protease activity HflC (stomatin/prohibitin superfamily)
MAVQPAGPAAESNSHEGSPGGSANLLSGLLVLFVLLIVALATALSGSSWLWLIGYGLLLVGFPIFLRLFVGERWWNLLYILYAMAAAGLVVGGLVQAVLMDMTMGIIAALIAALAVPIVLALLVRISASAVLGIHEWEGATPGDAFDYLWSILLGTNQPWVVIENGKVVGGKKQGIFCRLGGPGMVIVRPGNAAVLQHTGQISQIVGPGRYRTRRHEKIRHMLRLGPLWETQDVENVLTRDGVPLTVRLGVGYMLEPKADTDQRAGPPAKPRVIGGDYPVYEDTLRKAVLNVTPAGWEITAFAGSESQLRDIVGTYTLDQLFGLATAEGSGDVEFHESQRVIKRIEERIMKNFGPPAAEHAGIKIRIVDIQSVKVPAQVEEQMLEAWSSEWRQRTETAMRTATAQAWTKMERIKMEARRTAFDQVFSAIQRGLELFDSTDPRFDQYVDTISKLAVEMTKDSTSTYRYAEAVEKLMGHPNAHVVIAPPDTGLAFQHKTDKEN